MLREYERRREENGPIESERRRALKRKRKRRARNRKMFAFFFLIVLIFSSVLIVSQTPLFDIKSIEISGNSAVTDEEILYACGLSEGENIFSYGKGKMKNKILSLPYISKAEIKKKYPASIIIKVTEEKEVAAFEFAENYITCDRFGKSVRELNKEEASGFIILKGCEEEEFRLGEYVKLKDEKQAEIIKKALLAVEDYGLSNVTVIDVTDISDLKLIINDSLGVKFGELGDEDELSYKMAYIKEVMNKLPDNISGVIDASNPESGVSYRPGESIYKTEQEEAAEEQEEAEAEAQNAEAKTEGPASGGENGEERLEDTEEN